MEMGICVLRKRPIKTKNARFTCNSKNRVVNLRNLEKSRKDAFTIKITFRSDQNIEIKTKLTAPLSR